MKSGESESKTNLSDGKRKQFLGRLQRAIEKARAEWRGDANIAGIGMGNKQRGGEITDECVITFHVYKKLSSETSIRALGYKPIPREYAGFPTDVKVFSAKRLSDATGDRDETRFDPLVGGVATSNAEQNILWFNGWGTLGTLCFKDGVPMAMSNWHVWADGGDQGDDIIQPGHPRAGEHFEGLGKVVFCGPLLSSLLEWEAPSPLTWGLYGGAAAAAIAAAASDDIDPTRRGQQATPPDPGEKTILEQVEMKIKYPEQPIPGTPYRVDVEWEYQRKTDRRVLTDTVAEHKFNPHVLSFKQLWSDHETYKPGKRVRLFARIGSPHPRHCDSYYVAAHYIPDADPDRLVSAVLHPVSCDRIKPPDEGDGKLTCVDFLRFKPDSLLPSALHIDSVSFEAPSGEQNRIVDFNSDKKGELFLHNQLVVTMPLSTRLEITVICHHSLAIMAFHAGKLMAIKNVQNTTGGAETVILESAAIDRVTFSGAQWECSLLKFCYVPAEVPAPTDVDAAKDDQALEAHAGTALTHLPKPRRVCCYTGVITLPSTEQVGRWKGYLVVQNINDAPPGTPPEEAATIIGGFILSQNFAPNAVGCGAIMLSDHVFDVI